MRWWSLIVSSCFLLLNFSSLTEEQQQSEASNVFRFSDMGPLTKIPVPGCDMVQALPKIVKAPKLWILEHHNLPHVPHKFRI